MAIIHRLQCKPLTDRQHRELERELKRRGVNTNFAAAFKKKPIVIQEPRKP